MGWMLTCIGLLWGLSALSAADTTPIYNSQTVQTFQGEIVSVQKISFANKPAPYLQFIFRTAQGEYTVEAGPQWYLDARGITILSGEKIEVHGSIIEIEGKKIILADRLKQGNSEIKLRTSDGSPLSFMLHI